MPFRAMVCMQGSVCVRERERERKREWIHTWSLTQLCPCTLHEFIDHTSTHDLCPFTGGLRSTQPRGSVSKPACCLNELRAGPTVGGGERLSMWGGVASLESQAQSCLAVHPLPGTCPVSAATIVPCPFIALPHTQAFIPV